MNYKISMCENITIQVNNYISLVYIILNSFSSIIYAQCKNHTCQIKIEFLVYVPTIVKTNK